MPAAVLALVIVVDVLVAAGVCHALAVMNFRHAAAARSVYTGELN
jgi:hypothetical protein